MIDMQKKSLGQHWLHDDASLDSIVDTAKLNRDDTVLEIGPGLGTLTEKLLETNVKRVIAVEKDEVLAAKLSDRLDDRQFYLKVGDILEFDLTELSKDYKVVANIPYYLTSKLIRVLSESTNPPISVTLLLQKEVAQRLCAEPGQMSLLSVSAGMYYETNLGKVVSAKLFTPPPKVDSQIVHLARRPVPLFGNRDKRLLFRVIKAGFSNRRKTLLNSLSAGLHKSKEEIAKNLQIIGISPGQRPQELSLDDWIKLADVIEPIATK